VLEELACGSVTAGYGLPSAEELIRQRPLRRLVEPWLERGQLYSRYAAFLDRLASDRYDVLPLRELGGASPAERARIGLRHDVDDRLESALVFARLERERGLRATFFVLHSAPYYVRPGLIAALREFQDLGHEIGFHYDLVSLQVVEGQDPRRYLARELARLRANGIDVVGVSAHGSYWGHKLGYMNDYFFPELGGPVAGFPAYERVGDVPLVKGELREFGLEYDASQLAELHRPSEIRFWTDTWVDRRGRRWHPDLAPLDALGPGDRAILLVHPCLWDRSLPAKYVRTLGRLARRALGRR
jgi:hypothetical protein